MSLNLREKKGGESDAGGNRFEAEANRPTASKGSAWQDEQEGRFSKPR